MSLQDQVKIHNETGGSTFTLDGYTNLAGAALYSVVTSSKFSISIPGPVITSEDILCMDMIVADSEALDPEDNLALGTWYDADTDTSYIEIASLFEDLNAAIAAGKANNQKAIYDLKEGKVIFID